MGRKIKAKFRQHPDRKNNKYAKTSSRDNPLYSDLLEDDEGNVYEAQSDSINTLDAYKTAAKTAANVTEITGLCNDPKVLIFNSGEGSCDLTPPPWFGSYKRIRERIRDVDSDSQLTISTCGQQNFYSQNVTQPLLITTAQNTCATQNEISTRPLIVYGLFFSGLIAAGCAVYGIFWCCKKKTRDEASQPIIQTPNTSHITESKSVNAIANNRKNYNSFGIQDGEYKSPTVKR